MKIFKLAVLSSFCLFAENSSATCSGGTVDNRRPTFYNEENRTHMMRDQGDSGWCYAYASADLVTHYLARNNPSVLQTSGGRPVPRDRQMINPLSAVASDPAGKQFSNIKESMGGQPNQYMMDLFSNRNSRICLESETYSTNFTDSQNNVVDISAALNDVTRLVNADSPSPSLGLCQSWSAIYSNIFPGLTFSEFSGLISDLGRRGASNYHTFISLIQNACKNPVQVGQLPPVQRVRRFDNGSNNEHNFISALNAQLQSGNIVALEYDHSFLEDVNQLPILNGNDMQAPHVSSIVGRRCQNGEEQFLIRNSFGSGCEIYDRSLQCDNGNIWVSKDLLLRMSTRISHF